MSVILVLKCFSFVIDERRNLRSESIFVNIFVLFLIEKCVVQSILVEADLHLAVKLQPDLIIRAIL